MTVTASSVAVDSGVELTADQIFLVATDSIDLKANSTVSSTSGKSGTPLKVLAALENFTLSDGAGNALPQAGLLAVSDLALPVVNRSGSGPGASITLESGSHLNSGGALAIDAPGTVTLAGAIAGKGASWSLSSDSVAFVGSGNSTDSLNIGTAIEAGLQQAGAVRISSQSSIDLFAPIRLGAASADATPTLSSLTLVGATLNNQGMGDSVLGAKSLTLGGVTPVPGGLGPTAGSGALTLVADSLTIGSDSKSPPQTLAIGGFARTVAQVAGAIGSSGSANLLVGGDLVINAAELAPGAGSQTAIGASGSLTIGKAVPAAGSTLPKPVGGSLALSATSINDAGVIAAHSGVVSLTSTAGDLTLGATAVIDTAGTLLQAVNRSAASPGGMVYLSSAGNVNLAAGSTIDVSGEQIAPAGSLNIAAAGTATLAGRMAGNAGHVAGDAGSAGNGGRFSLDAGQLAGGLTPLATMLMSGGFSDSINVRVRSGDLDLGSAGASGAALSANSITLTSDGGAIDIFGTLTANSGAQRGFIGLNGGNGVTLEAGAGLHADGSGAAGLGGEIDINSISCQGMLASCAPNLNPQIILRPGSTISAYGEAQMGQLVLRAPALVADNDVAINAPSTGITGIGADVSRVGQVIVEPVMVFATSSASFNSDLSNSNPNSDIAMHPRSCRTPVRRLHRASGFQHRRPSRSRACRMEPRRTR